MFRKAVVSLTMWYLAIIMGLSLGFSLSLYQVFARQLTDNESRQEDAINRIPFLQFQDQNDFLNREQAALNDSLDTLRLNLTYFNIMILAVGGGISYFLAKRTLQPIQESAEAQNRFAGDASHELRTPLTAIRTELEVALRDETLSLSESKGLHRSTLEEIGKLEALAGALLRLSQHDKEQGRALFKPCDVAEVVKEAAAKLAVAAKEKKVTISIANVVGSVPGDFWSLVELFAILLDNAVKYAPTGSEITVSGHREGDRKLAVSVRDAGIGIDPKDLPHIFDRFYRADRSRSKDQVSGYGLGLSIARKIADLHRAVIEVESAQGQGSRFTVVLTSPARKAA